MTALLPMLGIVIGALLQYAFTRHLDGQRHHRERRAEAYADYLKAIADNAQMGNQLSPEAHEILARATDAKCRICLYGPAEVVEAFAAFERTGAALATESQRETFLHLVRTMRKDSGSRGVPADDHLHLMLLGGHLCYGSP